MCAANYSICTPIAFQIKVSEEKKVKEKTEILIEEAEDENQKKEEREKNMRRKIKGGG